MSLVNEMLRNLENEIYEKREYRGNVHVLRPDLDDRLYERMFSAEIKSNNKQSKFFVIYGIAFFILATWVWMAPKQVEKTASYVIHGAEDFYSLVKSVHKEKPTPRQIAKTQAEQGVVTKDGLTTWYPFLAEQPKSTEKNKIIAEAVKGIVTHVIEQTKHWGLEKEETLVSIAKPILTGSLKSVPDYLNLETVEIENAPGRVRLRLLVDGEINQSIEKTLDGRHINIILPNVRLKNALPPLAHTETPITGLHVNSRLGDLVLSVELRDETAVQSSLITHPDGTELVVDFMNDAAGVVDAAPAVVASTTVQPVARQQERYLPLLPPIENEAAPLVTPAETVAKNIMVEPTNAGRMRISPHRAQNLDVEGKLSVALRAMATGNLEEARLLLEENIHTYPRHAKSIATLADLLIQEGDQGGAKELLQTALKRLPYHPLLIKKMAEMYRKEGKFEEALGTLKKITPRFIDDPDYHGMLAALYQQQGNHHEAKEVYEKLVQYHPNEGMWWMGLALTQEAEGDQVSAMKSYKEAQSKPNMDGKLLSFINEKLRHLRKS